MPKWNIGPALDRWIVLFQDRIDDYSDDTVWAIIIGAAVLLSAADADLILHNGKSSR
jgi:hypothetical protein